MWYYLLIDPTQKSKPKCLPVCHDEVATCKCTPYTQVLLLPKFALRVTEEARLLDGFETVDLIEEPNIIADRF